MAVKVRYLRKNASGTKVYGLKIDHNGRRKTVTVGSKPAAEHLKKEVELELAKNNLGIIDPEPLPKFATIARDWLDIKKISRAPRTHERYKIIVNKHLSRSLMQARIDSITRGDVRNELLRYHATGASKSSVEMMHTVISGVFGHAIEDEYIQHSPARGLVKKLDIANQKTPINPFTQSQFDRFIAAVAEQYRLFYLTAYFTGARVGELIALQWSDVDLAERKIRIDKTAKDQKIRKCTKNYTIRDIDIADTLLEELTRHKKYDEEDCKKNEIPQKMVFRRRDGGMLSQQTLWRQLSKTCAKLGMGSKTIHDIRHTTISMLLARGVPVTYVSRMAGHSSPRITLDIYSHYIPDENRLAINALDGNKQTGYNSTRN